MNKQQAAEFLGVTTRAVERYTSQGKLSVRYEKGKTRPVAVFSEDELRTLKSEIENPPVHRPAVESLPATGSGSDSSQALTTTKPEHALAEFVGFLRGAFETSQRAAPSISDIAAKTLLKLDEAARLTGLSRGILREAIDAGKLKAKIVGRAWRIKRDDLDAYVRKL
jgi:excisionase family DNA binding protein